VNTPPDDILQRLLVARLPSPPQTLMRLMLLCQSDDVGMGELSQLIASDPGLAAKVLAVAHSAAYHRSDTQSLNLLQASSTLGMALIKVLVISESVFQTFHALRQIGRADLRPFWKHSLGVAVLARMLAERQPGGPGPDDAYLGGLLHDVGRLALLAAVPERYSALFSMADEAGLAEQEQRSLGLTHAEAGAWLMERWHLGESLVAAVLQHHEPAPQPAARPLSQILQRAHQLQALPPDQPEALSQCAGELGLPPDEVAALIAQAAQQVIQIARDLGVDISDAKSAPARQAAQPITQAQPLDAIQTQLAEEVLNRSVLNEMAMTLINLSSTNAALTSLRQHASALLQLEDTMVLLLRDNQQSLVPVSMNERHLAATPLSFDVAFDPSMAQCVAQRKLVFSRRDGRAASPLLDIMQANEVVLLPLLTAQHCLGVLAAAVPAGISQHIKSQTTTLQAFGVYAGLALSRRRTADKNRAAQTLSAKEAQQLELKRIAQAVNLLVDALSKSESRQPLGPVDLSLALRDIVQLLQHRQLIPGNIDIQSELPHHPAWVQASLGGLRQILLILIKNACEAMPDGGQVVLNGGVLVQRDGGVYTALSVSDSGASLKEAIEAQLYDPQRKRAETDKQGFGLSWVSHLVDQLGGHLKFSASLSGTRFEILLPCARNPSV
jgi:HD-like signal output (HDOD) protein/C4-dicarboxylate-specific signal transduction histidine kinase